jgi:hypothetical protein
MTLRPHRLVWLSTLVASVAAVSTAAIARADDASSRSLAEQLFSDGKKLMGEGKFDEACPKLAESQRLDPGGGTILNLAVCHESQGRFASAWSEFKEALGIAHTDGRRDREQLAQEHLTQVEPKVPHLAFAVDTKVSLSGLTIKLDGQVLGQAAWSGPLPVDPGPHDITASAPGKVDQRVAVQVAAGDSKTVAIHPLEDAPAQDKGLPETVQDSPGSSGTSGKRVAGYVVVGVGAAAVAAGAVFGIEAIQKRHDSDATCNGDTCSTQQGVNLNDDAKQFANIADVGIGVGVVAVVVGTYLIVTGGTPKNVPASTARRVNVTPLVGAGTSGVSLSGSW